MKLISMTDFVLEQKGDNLKYAHFLKQPLNLGMFVPCDEEGNVLEYPECECSECECCNFNEKYEQYQQAKERVLFENCYIIQRKPNEIVCYNDTGIWFSWEEKTIEDLIIHDLTLTKSAQKQLGL